MVIRALLCGYTYTKMLHYLYSDKYNMSLQAENMNCHSFCLSLLIMVVMVLLLLLLLLLLYYYYYHHHY